jgi:hypothetical protein
MELEICQWENKVSTLTFFWIKINFNWLSMVTSSGNSMVPFPSVSAIEIISFSFFFDKLLPRDLNSIFLKHFCWQTTQKARPFYKWFKLYTDSAFWSFRIKDDWSNSNLITSPSSTDEIVPSPSVSKSTKASFKSSISDSVNFSLSCWMKKNLLFACLPHLALVKFSGTWEKVYSLWQHFIIHPNMV